MELSVVSHWDAGQLERKEMPEHYGSLMQVCLTDAACLCNTTALTLVVRLAPVRLASACHAVSARA